MVTFAQSVIRQDPPLSELAYPPVARVLRHPGALRAQEAVPHAPSLPSYVQLRVFYPIFHPNYRALTKPLRNLITPCLSITSTAYYTTADWVRLVISHVCKWHSQRGVQSHVNALPVTTCRGGPRSLRADIHKAQRLAGAGPLGLAWVRLVISTSVAGIEGGEPSRPRNPGEQSELALLGRHHSPSSASAPFFLKSQDSSLRPLPWFLSLLKPQDSSLRSSGPSARSLPLISACAKAGFVCPSTEMRGIIAYEEGVL